MGGVTRTDESAHARLRSVPIDAVRLLPGFWDDRVRANHRGVHALLERLEAHGAVDNFRRIAGTADGERQGLFFTDSDVYKWMEAAAWSLATHPDSELEARLDDVTEAVVGAQDADGYLNTAWFDNRYQDLSWSHELYCAGHLFQAAVAHHRVSGDARLLDCAVRLADHLVREFGPAGRPEADGHPEIELALVELGRETGNEAYLDLARWFVDRVDHQAPDGLWGHAVKAQYYASALADLVLETGDAALRASHDQMWGDLLGTRSYVTGGVGGRWLGEAVGRPYELPNESAYAESCAGVASVMWAWRILQGAPDAEVADHLELALHNAALVGMSLHGDQWSYVNPLADAATGEHTPWRSELEAMLGANLDHLPARRTPFHPCTCCPTNVTRLFASLPGYLYGTSVDGVWVHLYAASTVDAMGMRLTQHTDYPWTGRVEIVVDSVDPGAVDRSIFVRVPAWCRDPSVVVDGRVPTEPTPGTYVELRGPWHDGARIVVDLPMAPELVECHPRVAENRAGVAVRRGPLVYCVEGVDHPGVDVLELGVRTDEPLTAEHRPELLGGVTVVRAAGCAPTDPFPGLYAPFGTDAGRALRDVDLTLVPYYAWANRGLAAMTVWLRRR